MGLFSTNNNAMTEFLKGLSGETSPTKAFIARNFLLDEGVSSNRYDSYDGNTAAYKNFGDWRVTHDKYLNNRVFRPGSTTGSPKKLDTTDMDLCPETFQEIDSGSPFLHTDTNLHLLRVEEINFIARRSGELAENIKQLGQKVIANGPKADSDEYKDLADIFENWSLNIELRPVFAGFWEDFNDLPEGQENNWANLLRDRLGLLHLDPIMRNGPINVFIFKYPVSDVPKLQNQSDAAGTRPLVPPTVLDGKFSAAFCPAPKGETTGYTIDLTGDSPPLRQEVLHPSICFSPSHLWRVGSIDKEIKKGILSEARGMHLLAVREHTHRNDYAAQTDADLLGK